MSIAKIPLFGVFYSITDYEIATKTIIEKASQNSSFGVSALAVHGLVTSYQNPTLKAQVNRIHLVVPDGQPIRWALNSFYKTGLKDRVYGPFLTIKVLEEANNRNLKVYLFGSTQNTCSRFVEFIKFNYPRVQMVGIHVDRFREATEEEDLLDIDKINNSGAHIVLVGRGCPRQEVWVANHIGKVHAATMAVGAAFDFYAGTVKQAPKWMQDKGLEWFFRLIQEPKRLWRRYLFTNTTFVYLFLKHKFLIRKPI
ncbi:MAG: WecB/TagA/CpsF family glycosyltransferase [Cyclobacteriaceae bacterium]|nr:WecB/TagA/CpsF family glycosyltransferase [Cyclobacteriaceae bacterium]